MASTVFGVPILNETMKTLLLPQCANKANPTQIDRAEAALLYKNSQDKDTNARKFVDELKKDNNEGGTGCMIYNATGDRITLVGYYDISGRVARSPYPIFIENGQWGVFLHGRFGTQASIGAVVYQGKNFQGQNTQWLLSWKVPNTPSMCYTDIRNTNEEQFNFNSSKQQWESAIIGPVVTNNNGSMVHTSRDVGSKVYATIGNTAFAIFEAILTITDS